MSKIKINFIYNSILAISQVLYPLITFPYVARILNPEGIGILSFVDSISKYFMLIGALGIPIYGIREIAKYKNSKSNLNSVFSELFLIHSIFTIITLLIYILVVFNIDKLQEYRSLLLLGITNLISNIFIVEWYFQGTENFKYITTRNIVVRFLSTILIFLFIKHASDLNKYYIIMITVPILNALINFRYVLKEVSLKFNLSLIIISIQKHIKPLLYIFISMSFISIYTILDTIILGILTDNKSIGIYSAAMKFAKIPVMFIGALSLVLMPKLSQYNDNGKSNEFIKLIEKSIRFIYFISIPIIFIIIGLSNNIIHVFVGDEYTESVFLLQVSSVLTLLLGLSNIFGFQILTTMSKDKYFTLCVGIGTISSIILNLICIPFFRIYGALFANIVSELLVTFLTYYYAKKFIKFNPNLKYFIRLILISFPILLVIILVKKFIYLDLIIISISFLLIFIYYYLVNYFIFKDEILFDFNNFLKKTYGRI